MTTISHSPRSAGSTIGLLALGGGAVLALAALGPDAAAAQNFTGNFNVLKKSCNFLMVIKTFFFNALYLLGAIGLGVIAVRAYLGQFSFKSLFALGGGVFIIAVADLIISFLTEDDVNLGGAFQCVVSGTPGG